MIRHNKKLKIMTDPAAFVGGSCFSYKPKSFEWEHVSEIPDSEPIVLYDYCILSGKNNTKNKNVFGWVGESSEVIVPLLEEILQNIDKYKEAFRNIFTHDRRLIEIDPDFFRYNPPASNMPWITEHKIYDKTKLCSFITSLKNITVGHQVRLKTLEYLRNNSMFVEDIYGRGHRDIETKDVALNDYMFSIIIENGFYPKYYTEKIMDAFVTGTVPVYVGDRSVCEDFDEEGIIFLEKNGQIDLSLLSSLSQDLYYSKMEHIKNNFTKTLEIEISDDAIARKVFQND